MEYQARYNMNTNNLCAAYAAVLKNQSANGTSIRKCNRRAYYAFETTGGGICLVPPTFRRRKTPPILSESRAGRDESCFKSVIASKICYFLATQFYGTIKKEI